MSLYKPTELHSFLENHGIQPRKGLSQNFLIDGNIIRKIVATANVQARDVVLEIGPGPGALTQALLAAGAQVVAVEKDAACWRTPWSGSRQQTRGCISIALMLSLSL